MVGRDLQVQTGGLWSNRWLGGLASGGVKRKKIGKITNTSFNIGYPHTILLTSSGKLVPDYFVFSSVVSICISQGLVVQCSIAFEELRQTCDRLFCIVESVCICMFKYMYLYLYFVQFSVASDELDQLVTDDFNCGFHWQAGSLMSATTIII